MINDCNDVFAVLYFTVFLVGTMFGVPFLFIFRFAHGTELHLNKVFSSPRFVGTFYFFKLFWSSSL